MGITVDYTPVGQVYETAKQAGSVQVLMQQDQRQQEQERFEMNLKAEQDSRQWQIQMEQEARTEDYQRALQLAEAKAQIDFDSEISMYQKKRAMMLSEIEQIQNSPILSDENKKELADRAYAKHFGTTLGNTTMENFLEKAQYKTALVRHLQEQVDQGMSPEEAKGIATANQISGADKLFPDEAEELRDDKNKLLIRIEQVRAGLARFSEKDPWDFKKPYVAIKDIDTGETRKATKPEIGIRDALIRQAGELVEELRALEQKSVVIPQNEIEAILQKLGPQYQEGWRLAQAEGMSFQAFLQKIGVKGLDRASVGGVALRKPNLLEKLSPMAAFGYMTGVKEYGKSLR